MPAENDKELLRRYHEQGDLQAREQLIEQYMSLVRSLARRYCYRGEQLDDLVQIGAIGLIKAIDRFDLEPRRRADDLRDAEHHRRDQAPLPRPGWAVRVPRGLQELNVQLSKLVEQLTVQLGRSPTITELAKAAGVEEEEVLEALESGRAYSSLSLSSGGGDEDGEELDPLESLGDEEHEYEVSEDRAVLAPGLRGARRARAPDPAPALLRGSDAVADRAAGRDLADARLAPDPPRRSRRSATRSPRTPGADEPLGRPPRPDRARPIDLTRSRVRRPASCRARDFQARRVSRRAPERPGGGRTSSRATTAELREGFLPSSRSGATCACPRTR